MSINANSYLKILGKAMKKNVPYWEHGKLSQQQTDYFIQMGFDMTTIKTRPDAIRIRGIIEERAFAGLATPKQLAYLKWKAPHLTDQELAKLTKSAASGMIAAIKTGKTPAMYEKPAGNNVSMPLTIGLLQIVSAGKAVSELFTCMADAEYAAAHCPVEDDVMIVKYRSYFYRVNTETPRYFTNRRDAFDLATEKGVSFYAYAFA